MGTPRVRTSGNISRPVMRNSWHHCDGSVTYGPYYDGPKTGTSKVTEDVVTPNFRQVVALGGIVNNPFSSTELSYSGSETGYAHGYAPTSGCLNGESYQSDAGWLSHPNWLGQLEAVPAVDPDAVADLVAVVSTRALANVAPASFEGFVNLGELPETIGMIKNPIGKLDQLLTSRNFLRQVEGAGSLYLMGRYGIRPLVNEISKGIEQLTLWQPPKPKRETARASGQIVESDSWSTTKDVAGTYRLNSTYTTKHVVNVRAGILYSDMLEFDRLRMWGVLPHHVPRALWELLPYSFVVDWFANVGDYLSAITPYVGVQQLAQWVTVREAITTARSTTSTYLISASGWSSTRNPSGTQSVTRTSVTRTPSLTAGLSFLPRNKVAGDIWKTLDLSAMIYQQLRPNLLRAGVIAGALSTLTSY